MQIKKGRNFSLNADFFSCPMRGNVFSLIRNVLMLSIFFLRSLAWGGSIKLQQSFSEPVVHDSSGKNIRLSVATANLVLRINYAQKCAIDLILVNGVPVISTDNVFSAVKSAENWYSTCSDLVTPKVQIQNNVVTISDINYGGAGLTVSEIWTFTVNDSSINWRINRHYLTAGILDEMGLPCWSFDEQIWTGALLGNGGVAWCKLFDKPNSTYGVQVGTVTFWNQENDVGLRIEAKPQSGIFYACKFSRQPKGNFSLFQYATAKHLSPKYDHYRFVENRQDIWQPQHITTSQICVEYQLTALNYDRQYDRGTFVYFDGEAIRSILNTIARVGVIDSDLMGSNSWRTPYGPAVLHEQWIAQMGLAIDDPAYFEAYKRTLNFQRDKAIEKDGRVKSRWAYHDGDAKPGSYDSLGFYECQWGYLLDSQPDFVINVAELFHFNGDVEWVSRHKKSCEKVLEYLLRRDSDGDYLVEMKTDFHSDQKGSDWIDVIWAAHENAFVNAEMYYALILWSEIELILGDDKAAVNYKNFAEKLKSNFNRTISEGGFWDPVNQWFIYWRDKDDSIHGNNLVTPVNFMAIAYGLCDDANQQKAILDRIEKEMSREDLFCWPLCLYPYQKEEGLEQVNFPFPNYENGDIFLAWGELAVRAYAEYDPNIPIKYIQKVLAKYKNDGLAFQRYLRKSQTGEGDDILANNCSPIVGLYRNIYGIQPRYNRFYLDPHLIDQLNGTILNYWLRDQIYKIELYVGCYSITVNNFKIQASADFAVNSFARTLQFFWGSQNKRSLSITSSIKDFFEIQIETWQTMGDCYKKWTETCQNVSAKTEHLVFDLAPHNSYYLDINGKQVDCYLADSDGCLKFTYSHGYALPTTFEIRRKYAKRQTKIG